MLVSIKMPFCPEKGQKVAKVVGAVGQNQLFCILLNIGTLDFFNSDSQKFIPRNLDILQVGSRKFIPR